MASSPITSWEIDGETVETESDFIFLGSKITMETESYVNKKGQAKMNYWCLWDGEVYQSDKTTYRRYKLNKQGDNIQP